MIILFKTFDSYLFIQTYFFLRDAMLAQYILWPESVHPSVRLSQVRVLSKRL